MAKIAASIATRLLTKGKIDSTLVTFMSNILYVGLLAFVVIAALAHVGIQTASFVAVIGAAGLAIGLAFQGSLSNLAAGVLLITFRPFKIGDFIEAAGETGVVEEIQIFTTIIKTVDNKNIIIPNAKLTGDNIINFTAEKIRRVDLTAGVSYSDDIDKVKSVLNDILKNDEMVLEDPKPQMAVSELADSSVNFVVRPWVKTEDYWDAYFGITEKIKKRLDEEGISIPFPQQDVHLFQEKS